jgi:serine/threonine protein kinase
MNDQEPANGRAEAGETRRDPGGPSHVARTRRDASDDPKRPHHGRGGSEQQHAADTGLIRLPPELAHRYRVVRELGVQGAEADVLLVRDARDASGQEFVVKLYRSGITVDAEVWDRLARLDTTHLVAVVETGTSVSGRLFEILEYAAAGTLRSLVDNRGRIDSAELSDMVRQIAAGLDTLHRAGIVHRDLKPENVLVRAVTPPHLVLTDFGLSKALDSTSIYTTHSRTLAYAAPESSAGHVSPALDWWALGMITRELATGRRPFDGLSEPVVLDHLATRPIALDQVADQRVRLLCRGLLARDRTRRWGHAHVQEWLAGDSPAAPGELDGVPRPGRRPLVFRGARLYERGEAARALAAHWADAARKYFAAMGSDGHPSEGWRTLLDWLRQFDDPESDDVDGRVELVDHLLSPRQSLPPDVKLLHLLRWLDPALPPIYRDFLITSAELARLVDMVLSTGPGAAPPAAGGIDDLARYRLLPVLSGFADAAELADVDRRWQGLVGDWDQLAEALRRGQPPSARPVVPFARESPFVQAVLLDLAANPDSRAAKLEAQARPAIHEIGSQLWWFNLLAAHEEDSPLRHLAVVCATRAALEEIEQGRQQRAEHERVVDERQRQWTRLEADRSGGRDLAIVHAGLGAVVALGLWFLVWLCAAMFYGGLVGLGVLLAWVGQLACEVFLAFRLAGEYHPRWSLLGLFGRWGGSMARRLGAVFGQVPVAAIFLTLVCTCCLPWFGLAFVGLVAPALPFVVGAWHGVWTYSRYSDWTTMRWREREAMSAMPGGREALGGWGGSA